MPKKVTRILCDFCKEKGELELIAQTRPRYGVQHGDAAEATFYFKCSNCGRIFFTDGGENFSVEAIELYRGGLSEEEIRKHIPEQEGYCGPGIAPYSEKDLLLKIRSIVTEYEVKVEKGADGKGHVELVVPPELIGGKAKISIY